MLFTFSLHHNSLCRHEENDGRYVRLSKVAKCVFTSTVMLIGEDIADSIISRIEILKPWQLCMCTKKL